MAEPAPNLVLLPTSGPSQSITLEVPRLPHQQARVDRIERERTIGNWGNLGGAQLTSVLRRAEKGDVADWYDLCEFFLKTDPALASYYTTRVDRVAQADFVVTPCTIGNQAEAQKAAALINDCLARIENWEEAKRWLLHAIAPGYACAENVWAYDEETGTNYVKSFDLVHGHRFRFDEQWNLRLYDHGHRRSEASQWGEALPPSKWTVHRYLPIAGYPGLGGLMPSCAYPLTFMRWVDKWWVMNTEKNGGPAVYATVPANTPESVRRQILEDLQYFTAQRVGVFENGTTITAEAAAAATKSYEAYKDYQAHHDAQIQKLWLGSSDQADPGAHGSNAAVSTRASATLDPRMVTDGILFAGSLRKTLFKQLIRMNSHKFNIAADLVPVPEFRFKSADDEVRRDASGMAQEQAEQAQESALPATKRGGKPLELQPPKVDDDEAEEAMEAAEEPSTKALLQILEAVAASRITAGAARIMLRRSGFSDDEIAASLDTGAVPKASAPVAPGRPTTKTRATSGRSASLIATARRVASGASASSSSKPQPQQLKL